MSLSHNPASGQPSAAVPRDSGSRVRVLRVGAIALLALGVLLVVASVAYLVYAQVARSRLSDLEYTVPPETRQQWFESSPAAAAPGAAWTPSEATAGSRFDSVYPADQINPKYWADPLWAGTEPFKPRPLAAGFTPVGAAYSPPAGAAEAEALRIRIPAIELDSGVKELAIRDLGDSREYETPANIVGHIPGTPNPGEIGNGWYFGHLEAPLRGEGNVFRRLPEIAELIKHDPVDIIIQSDAGKFVYRVVKTEVVYQDDLALYDSAGSTITLVACVPTRVYDHRLLVTAELIARG